MIFSIPLYVIVAVFNSFIIFPLASLGSFVPSAWASSLQASLQFVFQPLYIFSWVIDIPAALNCLGEMVGVVFIFMVFRIFMMFANWIRGSNASLREVDTYLEN